MTDPINFYNRQLGAVNGNKPAARKERVDADTPTSATGMAAPNPPAVQPRNPGDERLELSETARKTMTDPTFDRAKVEAIKTALKDGSYPLDSRRIAESFVALERLIDD